MYRNKLVVTATLLAALLVAMFVLTLPVPQSWQLPASVFYLQLAGYAVIACLHVGASVLFTINLGVYKAKLRRAYIAIAAGIVLTAIGTLQVPVIGALDAWQSSWVRWGGLIIPFFLSSLILYLATRYLTHLLSIKHLLTRAWLVVPAAFILSVLSSLLPHVDISIPEIGFDIALGIIVWSACLILAASILVFRIRRQAGAHYEQAMSWLTWALSISFIILAIQCVYTLIATDSTGTLAQLTTLLAIVVGLLWLQAGYAFALTKDFQDEDVPLIRALFGRFQPGANRPKTVLDMVTYAIGLVSNSKDIDPLVDDVLTITSKLQPGESPSPKSTRSLIAIYLEVEKYLTTKEVIRTFTKKDLRARLDPNLQKLLSTYKTGGDHMSQEAVNV